MSGRLATHNSEQGGSEASEAANKKLMDRKCQVYGCVTPLPTEKAYYRRFRICKEHVMASTVCIEGETMRFCQQCRRFQPMHEFDGSKRSCRFTLGRHNARRRRAAGTESPSSFPEPGARPNLSRTNVSSAAPSLAPSLSSLLVTNCSGELLRTHPLYHALAAIAQDRTDSTDLSPSAAAGLSRVSHQMGGQTGAAEPAASTGTARIAARQAFTPAPSQAHVDSKAAAAASRSQQQQQQVSSAAAVALAGLPEFLAQQQQQHQQQQRQQLQLQQRGEEAAAAARLDGNEDSLAPLSSPESLAADIWPLENLPLDDFEDAQVQTLLEALAAAAPSGQGATAQKLAAAMAAAIRESFERSGPVQVTTTPLPAAASTPPVALWPQLPSPSSNSAFSMLSPSPLSLGGGWAPYAGAGGSALALEQLQRSPQATELDLLALSMELFNVPPSALPEDISRAILCQLLAAQQSAAQGTGGAAPPTHFPR